MHTDWFKIVFLACARMYIHFGDQSQTHFHFIPRRKKKTTYVLRVSIKFDHEEYGWKFGRTRKRTGRFVVYVVLCCYSCLLGDNFITNLENLFIQCDHELKTKQSPYVKRERQAHKNILK